MPYGFQISADRKRVPGGGKSIKVLTYTSVAQFVYNVKHFYAYLYNFLEYGSKYEYFCIFLLSTFYRLLTFFASCVQPCAFPVGNEWVSCV